MAYEYNYKLTLVIGTGLRIWYDIKGDFVFLANRPLEEYKFF